MTNYRKLCIPIPIRFSYFSSLLKRTGKKRTMNSISVEKNNSADINLTPPAKNNNIVIVFRILHSKSVSQT